MLGPLCSLAVNLNLDSVLQYSEIIAFYFKAQQRLKENHASFNLRSKRFQSSYCVIVWAGAKKGGGKRGNPCLQTYLVILEKRPLIFHGLVHL